MKRFLGAVLVVAMLPVSLLAKEETAEVGKSAPDFVATGIDGKEFKLSSKISKDKNIIVAFSRASW